MIDSLGPVHWSATMICFFSLAPLVPDVMSLFFSLSSGELWVAVLLALCYRLMIFLSLSMPKKERN